MVQRLLITGLGFLRNSRQNVMPLYSVKTLHLLGRSTTGSMASLSLPHITLVATFGRLLMRPPRTVSTVNPNI